jgi:DNA-directed RNA polymerase subunit M/transcription elongation factor TFIIS
MCLLPVARYVSCYSDRLMQSATNAAAAFPHVSDSDIVFDCQHCSVALVVDAAAAGLAVNCQNCHKPLRVPQRAEIEQAAENAAKISDLQHQLKENESQRTEVTSYINQLSIQLHRWQLRLQTLNERQAKLTAELSAITGK